MRRSRIVLALFALVAAACGQYPGVHERAVADGEIPAAQTGLAPAGSTGVPAASGGTGGQGAVESSEVVPGTTGGAGAPASQGASGQPGSDPATGAQPAPAGGGTTTGITDTTIKIGLHAPLTGAAPLKAESFNRGQDMYWLRGDDGKPIEIHGRRVEVVFQDDQYNPSHARAVCQQMAEEQQVFLLVGGGGTDQIQACAAYAASKGIPYFSPGVTEIGVNRLPNYFAVSMSYADQAPLLAQYIKANQSALGWNGDPARIAMVITNTPNFQDAVDAFKQAMPGVKEFRPEKNERGSSMAGQLCTGTIKNYDVVFPLTAPTYWLEMAGASKCAPQYVGVGVSMGLDQVAETACRSGGAEDARFFSPGPAFADANQYAPELVKAGGTDDIMQLLWGISKTLHQLFLKTGPNLSREAFIASTSNASVKSGIFPDLTYTPSNHFGARQVHVLRLDCSRGAYVTEKAFASSF